MARGNRRAEFPDPWIPVPALDGPQDPVLPQLFE